MCLACSLDWEHRSLYADGVGLCLNGRLVSEAYAIIAGDMAEIGVVTDEKYQGQDLGTIVSAFMLEYCSRKNLQPIWCCYVSNKASRAIAKNSDFKRIVDSFF